MKVIIITLLFTCTLTILLESVLCLIVRQKLAWWKASVICNIVTNPILNVILMLLASLSVPSLIITAALLVMEVVVVFVEAYFYRCMLNKAYRHCFLFSLIANLLSFGIGTFFEDALFLFL